MTRRHAVLRADAGAAIGSGHVRRCLVLGRALVAEGWKVAIATAPESDRLVPELAREGWTRIALAGTPDDEPAIMRAWRSEGVDLLVCDHYSRDAAFEAACRPWAHHVLAIDDLADRRHDADILVDQTLDRDGADYAPLLPAGALCLTGPRYALLRPEFEAARARALAFRAMTGDVARIQVSVGAADQTGMVPKILRGLAIAGYAGAVELLGSRPKDASDLPFTLDAVSDADDIAARMSRADLAIGACGTTSWERCCLALPTIAVVTADNQRTIAEALAAAGAVELLGDAEAVSARDIASAVVKFVRMPAVRQGMSMRAARICDGAGAARVVAAINRLLAGEVQAARA